MKSILIISYDFNEVDTSRAFTVYNSLKESYDCTVVYSNFDHYLKKKNDYKNSDYESISVPVYKKNISLRRICSNLVFSFKLKKYITNKYDLVYIIFPPNVSAFVGVNVAAKLKIPTILDVVDIHPESLPISSVLKKLFYLFGLYQWKKLRQNALIKASSVVLECDYYREFIPGLHVKPINTIYLTKLKEKPFIIDENYNDEINILYLGSINLIYDFESLLNLCLGLKNREKLYHLYIIGDGQRREWLIEQFEKNGVVYSYLGIIYDENIKWEIIKKCHFGFNGYKKNTNVALSYKSIDYLFYGLPIINSAKHDTWDIVEKKKIGFNYDSQKIDLLVECLLETNNVSYKALKRNVIKTYDELFHYDKYKKSMELIIKETIKHD